VIAGFAGLSQIDDQEGGKMSTAKERVTFGLRAPEAKQVFLAGTFNGWSTDEDCMKAGKNGVWKMTKKLQPGRYEYKFVVDGVWKLDPACTDTVRNHYGTANNVLEVVPGMELATKKDAYIAKMRARLDKWQAEIDKLEVKAAKAKGATRSKYRRQIKTLRSLQGEFEEKLEETRQSVSHAWEELKKGLENAWKALSQSIKSAKSKIK
jgi:hypothetical protein